MSEPLTPLSGMNGGPPGNQKNPAEFSDDDSIRLEISEQTLQRLLSSGQLSAADFRCLDCTTKHCVWQLMARLCAQRMGCEGCCAQCDRSAQKTTVYQLNPQVAYGKF